MGLTSAAKCFDILSRAWQEFLHPVCFPLVPAQLT